MNQQLSLQNVGIKNYQIADIPDGVDRQSTIICSLDLGKISLHTVSLILIFTFSCAISITVLTTELKDISRDDLV